MHPPGRRKTSVAPPGLRLFYSLVLSFEVDMFKKQSEDKKGSQEVFRANKTRNTNSINLKFLESSLKFIESSLKRHGVEEKLSMAVF